MVMSVQFFKLSKNKTIKKMLPISNHNNLRFNYKIAFITSLPLSVAIHLFIEYIKHKIVKSFNEEMAMGQHQNSENRTK